MARTMFRLTKLAVDRAGPGLHPDGGGLYLSVGAKGARSWLFRFERHRKNRWHGLGSVRAVSLVTARVAAQRCREHLDAGRDPIKERRAKLNAGRIAAANAKSFREAVEAYVADHEAGWINPKTRSNFLSTMEKYAYPVLGDMIVGTIEPEHVRRVLRPIWTKKLPTAKRLRQRIEQVMGWAIATGLHGGPNPAAWTDLLEHSFPAPSKVHRKKNLRALAYAKMPAFMTSLRDCEGSPARVLEFLILSAMRATAVREARWEEIDLTEKTWTVPDNVSRPGTKLTKSLTVPLTARMIEILEAMRGDREVEGDELVFPGARKGRPHGHDAMRELLADLGVASEATAHGMRSTFRTWCGEETNYPSELAEVAIGHAVDDLEASYNRGEKLAKRRRLMDTWTRFVGSPPRAAANVTPIRRKAAG